jgi:hypothetical protein
VKTGVAVAAGLVGLLDPQAIWRADKTTAPRMTNKLFFISLTLPFTFFGPTSRLIDEWLKG